MNISEDPLSSNIKQGENPQLKEPPLQIEMNPSELSSSKIRSIQEIQKLSSNCIAKIQEMFQQTRKNERLQKYFNKAGTNSEQMHNQLNKLLSQMAIMRKKVHQKGSNLLLIGDLLAFMDQILTQNVFNQMKNIEKAIWIIEFESKVNSSMQLIMTSLNLPFDITMADRKHYEGVWELIKMENLGKPDHVKNGLEFTKKMMMITTSACIDQSKCEYALTKIMSFGLSYPQYFFSDKEGQLKSMIFYRRPTIQLARHIWNLPENGMTMQFAKLGMKSIQTNIKIYIPYDEHKQPKDIFTDDGHSIQVRVLYNDDIFLKNKKKSKLFGFCSSSIDETKNSDIDTIVLHMHGGGFLALSSRSMQIYTRRWARDLRVPVFSIDYRMPSEHRFPTAPNDCLTVYKFLLRHIHKYINVNPKKIIIAGDSAGGNLAFALTGLILKQKLHTPHGVYAAYPACDLRRIFSPSKLFAFTDPLLNPTMLLLCLNQYLGSDRQNQTNPIASPIFLTEQFVGGHKGDKRFPLRWPKTIIQVGAQDPLYDDTLKIMERMASSKIDCECQVYENLPHGFLNLEFIIPECLKTIKDSVTHLQKLLK